MFVGFKKLSDLNTEGISTIGRTDMVKLLGFLSINLVILMAFLKILAGLNTPKLLLLTWTRLD